MKNNKLSLGDRYSSLEISAGTIMALSEMSVYKLKKFLTFLESNIFEDQTDSYWSPLDVYLVALDFLPIRFVTERRFGFILEFLNDQKYSLSNDNVIKSKNLIIKAVNSWSIKKLEKNDDLIKNCKAIMPKQHLGDLVALIFLKKLILTSQIKQERRFVISCLVSENKFVKELAIKKSKFIKQKPDPKLVGEVKTIIKTVI